MRKQIVITLVVSIILVLALASGIYFVMKYSGLESIVPATCQNFRNESFSGAGSQEYICQADECYINAQLTTAIYQAPRVLFKTQSLGEIGYQTPTCIYANYQNTGTLRGQMYSSSSSTTSSIATYYNNQRPADGLKYRYTGTSYIPLHTIRTGSSVNYFFNINLGTYTSSSVCTLSADISTSTLPQWNCLDREACYNATISVPKANFGLCQYDASGNLVGGADCSRALSGVATFTSTPIKLLKGEKIIFNPVYEDGISVAVKSFSARIVDCSCKIATERGEACTSNQKYCVRCPTTLGYAYSTSNVFCANLNGVLDGTERSNICSKYDSNAKVNLCVTPFSYYKTCDGTALLGIYSQKCNEFKNEVGCTQGSVCTSTAGGEGLGDCACNPLDACQEGRIKVNPSNPVQYKKCVKVNGCTLWENTYTDCAGGLVANTNIFADYIVNKSDVCVCNPSLNCLAPPTINSGTGVCNPTNTGYKTCINASRSDSFGGNYLCYIWSQENTCTGGTSCAGGSCSCGTANTCTFNSNPLLNPIKCIDSTHYSTCGIDPSVPNSCFDFRGTNQVTDCQTCDLATNKIITKTGCACGNPAPAENQKCENNVLSYKTDYPYCVQGAENRILTANTYEECLTDGAGAYKYQSKTCPNGYGLRGDTKKCELNLCNPTTTPISCTGEKTYDSCALDPTYPVSSFYAYRNLGKTTDNCHYCDRNIIKTNAGCTCSNPKEPDNRLCVNNCIGTACPCKEADPFCKNGDKNVYIDSSSYWACVSDGQGCFVKQKTTCPQGQQVESIFNVACKPFGCQYESPSSSTYSCTALLEECVNNVCTCIQDSNSCTSTDASAGNLRCNNNVIQNCVGTTTKTGKCYKWKDSIPCGTDVCSAISGKVSCNSPYDTVGIVANDISAVGSKVSFKVVVTSKVAGYQDSPITWDIKDAETGAILDKGETGTNTLGEVIVNSDFAPSKSQTIMIEAYVGSADDIASAQQLGGTVYSTAKNISVLKTLKTTLTCPISSVVNREVSCEYKAEDFDTGELIPASFSLDVAQGTSALTWNKIGTNKIVFTPKTLGNVFVKASSKYTGYIGTNQSTKVIVQGATITQTFFVDNVDISTMVDAIKIGTHQLKLKIDESGSPVEIQSINLKVYTPSGGEDNLVFNKAGDSWSATYNFAQAGQVYIVKGEIVFAEITKKNIPLEYTLNTLGTTSEDLGSSLNMIYIGIGIGAVVLIIFIGLGIYLKRRNP